MGIATIALIAQRRGHGLNVQSVSKVVEEKFNLKLYLLYKNITF